MKIAPGSVLRQFIPFLVLSCGWAAESRSADVQPVAPIRPMTDVGSSPEGGESAVSRAH